MGGRTDPDLPRENETSDATQQSGQKESQQNLPVDPNADPCRAERLGAVTMVAATFFSVARRERTG